MSKSKESLASQISDILNSAPKLDAEDDVLDSTCAKVVDVENEDSEEEAILSKFRRQNVDLLEDVDHKYAGKKSSRRNLRGSESEDSSVDDENTVDEEYESEGAESEVLGTDDDNTDAEDEDTNAEDEDTNAEDEDTDAEETDTENDNTDAEEDEGDIQPFKHLSDSNLTGQVKKGLCVRNQMSIWENLLETRIQLQKCLLGANKMPSVAKFQELREENSSELASNVTKTKNTLCKALDSLLVLQKLLVSRYPETKKLESKEEEGDDEEIPSDTEPEDSEEEADEPPVKKRRTISEYENHIGEQHTRYKTYRNSVIQKWNDKTRIIFKETTTPHSVLDQIEYNLNNKEKLVKRTQVKRSQYQIIGENETQSEECNTEIFDDGDFYHQLLRELIEVKSVDITDPVKLGQQWIQLQSLRSKMKRKIDTRATKARKIRYLVHSKIGNYMAPIEEHPCNDDANNELHNSLFGNK